jgi:hypothetical protein
VSFEELRSLGIENPAVLCYELELVGIPIARVHRYEGPGRAVPVGVRIEESGDAPEALDPSAAAKQRRGSPTLPTRHRTHRAREIARTGLRSLRSAAAVAAVADRFDRRAVLVWTIALVALAIGTTLALTGQTGSPRTHLPTGRHSARHPRVAGGAAASSRASTVLAAATATAGARSKAGSAGGVARRASVNGAQRPLQRMLAAAVYSSTAARLQAQGHRLLGEGRYAAAIGELRAALTASGQSSARCAVPGTEACLTYAYALYDLGRALTLNGEPRNAVGVLTERLHIDNQRTTVREELARARSAAGAGGATRPGSSERGPNRSGHPKERARSRPQLPGPAPAEGRPGGRTDAQPEAPVLVVTPSGGSSAK